MIFLFAGTAVFLAVMLVGMILRIQYLAIASMILGAWVFYFLLMTQVAPWYRYKRFLRDMDEGLSRESEGWFVSLSESARVADGVAVHDFVLRVGDEEEDERLFLWDDDKPLPELSEGQRIHVTSFSNFIKELVVIDSQG